MHTSSLSQVDNRILASKTHQLGGFEGGAKPGLVVDAQLVDVTQSTTKSTWEKGSKYTTIKQNIAEIH